LSFIGIDAEALRAAAAGGIRDHVAGYWKGLLAGEFGAAGLPFNSRSNELEASRVVKSGRGILFGISGINTNVAAQFIQIHDAGSVPSNGAVPEVVIAAAAGASNFSMDWIFPGRFFQRGIVIVNSSTSATLTIGAADCWFDAQYI
jgi:hypothetical protein